MLRLLLMLTCIFSFLNTYCQFGIKWDKEGNSYSITENGSIVSIELPSLKKTTILEGSKLIPGGSDKPIRFFGYELSGDRKKVLLFTDARREYHNTFSNCWVFDLGAGKLYQVAKGFAPSSLLNTKFSPDGSKLAFVYNNNIYVEDLAVHKTVQLTKDGNERKLNGWFD